MRITRFSGRAPYPGSYPQSASQTLAASVTSSSTPNANVAPDALTVGPMAGHLGAPLFITNKEALGEDTRDALIAHNADLIVVAGGPGSVTDAVLTQIAAATGLDIQAANTAPSSGIVRV